MQSLRFRFSLNFQVCALFIKRHKFLFCIHLDREQNILILLISFSSKRQKVHSTVFLSSIDQIPVVIISTIVQFLTEPCHFKFLLVQVSFLEYFFFPIHTDSAPTFSDQSQRLVSLVQVMYCLYYFGSTNISIIVGSRGNITCSNILNVCPPSKFIQIILTFLVAQDLP